MPLLSTLYFGTIEKNHQRRNIGDTLQAHAWERLETCTPVPSAKQQTWDLLQGKIMAGVQVCEALEQQLYQEEAEVIMAGRNPF